MSFGDHIDNMLKKPLDPDLVYKRKGGGGTQLSYLKAHDVRRQMNNIFGFGGWSCVTTEVALLSSREYEAYNKKKGKTESKFEAIYRAKVLVSVGLVNREGCGVGNGTVTNHEGKSHMDAHELGVKEAESDAFKRACINFGDQFGLALYDPDQVNVEVPTYETSELDAALVSEIQLSKTLEELQGVMRKIKGVMRKHYIPLATKRKEELGG